mmetsp:Transcript_4904/g.4792  ORF Transcript_4904/g.4792 Transcript_4904/m.4792 type:complete len:414 (+) Transcript_4904:315-1556(+)
MQHIIEGFKALRAKNIIHRDMKLQNILLTEASTSATLKLADFGMSRFLDDDLAQSWLGTPLYMAPEMFRWKEGYDAKADIWSLGVVFYEILTGEAPFNAKRREEIPHAQKKLKSLPANLSPLCQDLLMRMLSYDPKSRISFEELFEHPFILPPKEDEYSIKASKGSSDSMISSDTNNLQLPKEENSESSKSDDFVLLSNEESCTDFVFLAKNNHPAVNLTEVVGVVEKQIETAVTIIKLAERIKANNEIIGSFAVYVKAMMVLENSLEYCQQMIDKHALNQELYPAFFELFERVKTMFMQNQDKAEELCKEVDKLLAISDPQKLTTIDSIGTQGLGDSLIYNYAISLCKEGAKDEYLKDYPKSKEKYLEATTLLDALCKGKGENPSDEWIKVENFKIETHRRLETVNVKLTTE